MYYNAPLPTLSFSNNQYANSFSYGVMPAAGYVFNGPDDKFRPFVGAVLDFGIQHNHNKPAYQYGGNRYWESTFNLDLRLGAYYQTCERWWLYGQIDAPTGHSLFAHYSMTNEKSRTKFFNNTYDAFLPKIEIGAAYRFPCP
jgi:hypothetical protein